MINLRLMIEIRRLQITLATTTLNRQRPPVSKQLLLQLRLTPPRQQQIKHNDGNSKAANTKQNYHGLGHIDHPFLCTRSRVNAGHLSHKSNDIISRAKIKDKKIDESTSSDIMWKINSSVSKEESGEHFVVFLENPVPKRSNRRPDEPQW
jgi:hypothetical protein